MASPIDCPGVGSDEGMSTLANSFSRDFAMFKTTMNCQTIPKTGMSMSQTLPGAIVLDTGAHFFSAFCNASR
jgi:hypothetical protein